MNTSVKSQPTGRRFLFRILLLSLLLGGTQFVGAAPKTTTKPEVIDEIVKLTLPTLPVEMHRKHFDGVVSQAPNWVSQTLGKSLADQIDKDSELSEAQKSSLKAGVPDLLTRAHPAFQRIVEQKFGTVESFLVGGLRSSLSTLSVGEVIEIHTFVASDAGKSYLKAVKTLGQNMTAAKPKPLEFEEKYAAQTSDFLNSLPGKKFNDAMIGSAEGLEARLTDLMGQVFEEINKDPELDRLYKEFKAGV